jgi:CBS domain-containing protein
MKTIDTILEEKGREVVSIGPDATVYEALKLMAERNIGAVVVIEDGKPVGLLSERDYARNVILKGRASHDTPVRDIMETHVPCISPAHKPEECMALMTEKRTRHLPVMDGEELVGLISIGDLVKAIIDEQKIVIEHLERYIAG